MRTYRINEIFYSLQGEGYWAGTPMIFVRFSGCNLKCGFCDTDFESFITMTESEIMEKVKALSLSCKKVCLTGGEPSLHIDSELINAFHSSGYEVHIETNGTHVLPSGIDWITLSPKEDWCSNAEIKLKYANELKLVYTGQNPEKWLALDADYYYLQPCSCKNTTEVVDYIMKHPQWRISLQIHKYLSIR